MGLPQSAYLGKRIYKKLFQEYAKLGVTDKKALREDVESVIWEYTLKPSTVPIKPFSDEKHEYLEIAIIQVNLTSRKRADRLAEIIHRAIPYPIGLILVEGSGFRMSLATKRFSQAEKGAIVADEFFATQWMDLGALKEHEESFLKSLAIASLPSTDFKALYDGLVSRVVALECGVRTGRFEIIDDKAQLKACKTTLAECCELEASIAEEQAAVRRATQINQQVDGNLRIQRLRAELQQMVKRL